MSEIVIPIKMSDEGKKAFGPAGYMLYVKKEHEEKTIEFLKEAGFQKYEPRSGPILFKDLHRNITECDWCREPFKDTDDIVTIWRVDNDTIKKYNELVNKVSKEKV